MTVERGRIGSVFVELDLDESAYTRKQKAVLASAQSTSLSIEKNFQNLGITSDKMYDAMRQRATNAYDAIKASGVASANEIMRAEMAKNTAIQAANEAQFGKHVSWLDKVKGNYLAVSASIASTVYVIQQAAQAAEMLAAPFIRGFQAVEQYNLSVASMGAMVMSFAEKQEGVDLASQWKQSLEYAQYIVPELENIAAKTLLSGQETTALANAWSRVGVFLDATNESQVKAFMRISNALPLLTQGQEIMRQINTEVRSLATGQNEASSMLLQTLKAIDPEVENHLKTWREQGTVLEHVGDLLSGFGPATELLENQWQTVKSSMDTTVMQTLRGGMMVAYDEIIGQVKSLDDLLREHKDSIGMGLRGAWFAVRGILETVWNVVKPFGPLLSDLGALTGTIATGWGLLAYAVLPPVAERIGLIVDMVVQAAELIKDMGKAAWSALTFNDEGITVATAEMSQHFQNISVSMGQIFAKGFGDEIVRRSDEFTASMNKAFEAAKPPKGAYTAPEDKKAEAEAAREALRIQKELYAEAVKAADLLRIIKGDKEKWTAGDQIQYELKFAADSAKAYGEIYRDLKGDAAGYYEFELTALQKQRDSFSLYIKDKALLDAWYEKKKKDLDREQALRSDDFFTGLRVAYSKSRDDLYTWAKAGSDTYKGFTESARSTLQTGFFDLFKGNLRSFGDYWKSFWGSMYNVFANILSRMVEQWIEGQIAMQAAASGLTLTGAGVRSVAGVGTGAGLAGYAGASAGTGYSLGTLGTQALTAAPYAAGAYVLYRVVSNMQKSDSWFRRNNPVNLVASGWKDMWDWTMHGKNLLGHGKSPERWGITGSVSDTGDIVTSRTRRGSETYEPGEVNVYTLQKSTEALQSYYDALDGYASWVQTKEKTILTDTINEQLEYVEGKAKYIRDFQNKVDTGLAANLTDNLEQWKASLEEYYTGISDTAAGIFSSAMSGSLQDGSFDEFKTGFYSAINDTAVDAMINAFAQGELYQNAMGPWLDALNQNINAAMTETGFNSALFRESMAGPTATLQAELSAMTPALEEFYNLLKSLHIGGYATGLDYVPSDNFPAILHKGEAVLPADEADEWRSGGGGDTYQINLYATVADKRAMDDFAEQIFPRLKKIEKRKWQ